MPGRDPDDRAGQEEDTIPSPGSWAIRRSRAGSLALRPAVADGLPYAGYSKLDLFRIRLQRFRRDRYSSASASLRRSSATFWAM